MPVRWDRAWSLHVYFCVRLRSKPQAKIMNLARGLRCILTRITHQSNPHIWGCQRCQVCFGNSAISEGEKRVVERAKR